MSRSQKFKSPLQNYQHQRQRYREGERQRQRQKQRQREREWQSNQLTISLLTILIAIIANIYAAEASQDTLSHICDSVECPALSDIICPDDSDIRDSTLLSVTTAAIADTISSSSISSTAAPVTTSFNNASDFISQSIYAQCCLSKKCICKTCYIPDCQDEKEVVIELVPESMDTPGHCCGQYDCQQAPNCTEVVNTENYWLTDCQRCKCYNGERICHQSCDEGLRKSTAICNSKTLNTFFENGDVWKDGCYECECVNGEEKCVMPLCRSLNCPKYRQVTIKDSCCPVCWPKCSPMPNGDQGYDDEDLIKDSIGNMYDDDDNDNDDGNDDEDEMEPIIPLRQNQIDNYASGNEIDTLLPNINFEKDNRTKNSLNINDKVKNVNLQSTVKTETDAANTTTRAAGWEIFVLNTTTSSTTNKPSSMPPYTADNVSNNEDDASATYQVFPKMVHTSDQNYLYYTIIGVLGMIVVVLGVWNVHLRAKQRSYRPVSNFDDNFNKMSSNIKKMNDYV